MFGSTSSVKSLLRKKTVKAVWCIEPNSTVFQALQHLSALDVGALVVTNRQMQIVGLFSERDYARKVILHNRTSLETSVRQVMTKKIYYVLPEDTVEYCMVLMTRKKIRHLPVIDQDQLVGLVSVGDVIKEAICDREFLIEQLVGYITNSRSTDLPKEPLSENIVSRILPVSLPVSQSQVAKWPDESLKAG